MSLVDSIVWTINSESGGVAAFQTQDGNIVVLDPVEAVKACLYDIQTLHAANPNVTGLSLYVIKTPTP